MRVTSCSGIEDCTSATGFRTTFGVGMTRHEESVVAYISLGSNQGDAPANLASALVWLGRQREVRLGRVSSVYFTEPQGYREQEFFANQVAELSCPAGMPPQELLVVLQRCEKDFGRIRSGPRFGPRILDLDILTFGDVVMISDVLTLPHPRVMQRAFALVPLAELAPNLAFPQGNTVQETLARLSYELKGRVILQSE